MTRRRIGTMARAAETSFEAAACGGWGAGEVAGGDGGERDIEGARANADILGRKSARIGGCGEGCGGGKGGRDGGTGGGDGRGGSECGEGEGRKETAPSAASRLRRIEETSSGSSSRIDSKRWHSNCQHQLFPSPRLCSASHHAIMAS